MRRTLIAILLALALAVIPAANAFAAKTADVTVTATGGHLSIAITAGSPYGFGTVVESDNVATALTQFTLTNDGTVTANIVIHGHNTTVGGGGTLWTLSDTGVPGVNTYGLFFSRNSAPGWTVIPTTDVPYMSNLLAAGTDQFGFQLSTPTTIADTTNQQTAITTLTASKA